VAAAIGSRRAAVETGGRRPTRWVRAPGGITTEEPGGLPLHDTAGLTSFGTRLDGCANTQGLLGVHGGAQHRENNPDSSEATSGTPGTSEPTHLKGISEHVPTHRKPSDMEFGYYLAGLIESEGSFQGNQLIISFHELDAPLAYYIKKEIGYGSVSKIQGKRAYKLVISKKAGVLKVIRLIDGKLRGWSKIEQVKRNWDIELTPANPESCLLNDSWLAGFSDAGCCAFFQVKAIERTQGTTTTAVGLRTRRPAAGLRVEIRLNFKVEQKIKDLLTLIQATFGGDLGYRKATNTYYYGSTSFTNARKIIRYFDHYHLLSSKHINYLKWRKVFLLIQGKAHRTPEGIKRILAIKGSMNRNSHSDESLDAALRGRA